MGDTSGLNKEMTLSFSQCNRLPALWNDFHDDGIHWNGMWCMWQTDHVLAICHWIINHGLYEEVLVLWICHLEKLTIISPVSQSLNFKNLNLFLMSSSSHFPLYNIATV